MHSKPVLTMPIILPMRTIILIGFAAVPLASADGPVQITVKGNDKLCLDLLGGSVNNGNPIDIWTCSGVKGQQWLFDEGTFKIRSVIDPSKCIDAGDMKQGTQLKIYDCNIQQQQFWSWSGKTDTIFLYSQAGPQGKGLCLDVKDAVFKDGSAAQVWSCDGLSNQGWTISVPKPPPKPFKIALAGQNKCLDLLGTDTKNGNKIDVWTCSGGKGQQWFFEPNSFQLKSVVDPKKCIDASNMAMRSLLSIWDCNGQPQQQWGFDSNTGEIFLGKDIKKKNLCMCLTDFKDGSQLQLYTCNGQGTEKWSISGAQLDAPQIIQPQIV